MMNNCDKNDSIRCTVNNCKHHCGNENYCTLQNVTIGTHETNPTMCQCVDCESFQLK